MATTIAAPRGWSTAGARRPVTADNVTDDPGTDDPVTEDEGDPPASRVAGRAARPLRASCVIIQVAARHQRRARVGHELKLPWA